MAKKMISTIKPKSDMGKVIASTEKEAFEAVKTSKSDDVISRLEEKIASIKEEIDNTNAKIMNNCNVIEQYEQENARLHDEIDLYCQRLAMLNEVLLGDEA